ncbi:hypothetical protein BC829DRAFT_414699 [Chytridium lagenaria]|nr:hypothetical protein BC829DRAFT_414699 [Chytridium lagenaria]
MDNHQQNQQAGNGLSELNFLNTSAFALQGHPTSLSARPFIGHRRYPNLGYLPNLSYLPNLGYRPNLSYLPNLGYLPNHKVFRKACGAPRWQISHHKQPPLSIPQPLSQTPPYLQASPQFRRHPSDKESPPHTLSNGMPHPPSGPNSQGNSYPSLGYSTAQTTASFLTSGATLGVENRQPRLPQTPHPSPSTSNDHAHQAQQNRPALNSDRSEAPQQQALDPTANHTILQRTLHGNRSPAALMTSPSNPPQVEPPSLISVEANNPLSVLANLDNTLGRKRKRGLQTTDVTCLRLMEPGTRTGSLSRKLTAQQKAILTKAYEKENIRNVKPCLPRIGTLSRDLNIPVQRLKVWFSNHDRITKAAERRAALGGSGVGSVGTAAGESSRLDSAVVENGVAMDGDVLRESLPSNGNQQADGGEPPFFIKGPLYSKLIMKKASTSLGFILYRHQFWQQWSIKSKDSQSGDGRDNFKHNDVFKNWKRFSLAEKDKFEKDAAKFLRYFDIIGREAGKRMSKVLDIYGNYERRRIFLLWEWRGSLNDQVNIAPLKYIPPRDGWEAWTMQGIMGDRQKRYDDNESLKRTQRREQAASASRLVSAAVDVETRRKSIRARFLRAINMIAAPRVFTGGSMEGLEEIKGPRQNENCWLSETELKKSWNDGGLNGYRKIHQQHSNLGWISTTSGDSDLSQELVVEDETGGSDSDDADDAGEGDGMDMFNESDAEETDNEMEDNGDAIEEQSENAGENDGGNGLAI